MKLTISISGLIGLLIGLWAVTHHWIGTPTNPWRHLDHTLGVIVIAIFVCTVAGVSLRRAVKNNDRT